MSDWPDGVAPGLPLTAEVLRLIVAERRRQEAKWGEQNHPDGTGAAEPVLAGIAGALDEHDFDLEDDSPAVLLMVAAREACKGKFDGGEGSYADVLLEEVFEALAEEDPQELVEELVQVAAVAVAWIEKKLRGR